MSGPLCLIDTAIAVYINTPSRQIHFSALNVDGSNFQPQRSGPHCSGPTTLDTMKLWASLMLALTALPMIMAQESSLTQTLAKFPDCAVSGHVEFYQKRRTCRANRDFYADPMHRAIYSQITLFNDEPNMLVYRSSLQRWPDKLCPVKLHSQRRHKYDRPSTFIII